jgi:hypothetical protein
MNDGLLAEIGQLGIVDDRELLYLLERDYGHPQISDRNVLIYPGAERYAIAISEKDGRIKSIQSGPGFDRAIWEQFKGSVRRVLIDQAAGPSIAAYVLFSSRPIIGSFRSSSGLIQIRQAPPEAPRPGVVDADHPFILEFPIRRSTDGFLTNMRRLRGALEWTWTLNAVLRHSITCLTPRVRFFWGLCTDESGGSTTRAVRWSQEYYELDRFQAYLDGFSEPGETKIPTHPHREYYQARYLEPLDTVTVPDSLSKMLEGVAVMPSEGRKRFLRSAQWRHVANKFWDVHVSSWFTSLVSSIESLMDPPTERCPTCNAVLKVTQRFKDFVERYAPNSDPGARGVLYGIRSNIAHGSGLMSLDEAVWDRSLRSRYLEELDAQDELARAARDVQVNWLLEKSPVH